MKPKMKFSSELMFPQIKEYLSSNVSRIEFCNQKGIKPHILQYWLKKYHTTEKKARISSFTPIQIEESSKSLINGIEQVSPQRHILIKTSKGLEIQIPV